MTIKVYCFLTSRPRGFLHIVSMSARERIKLAMNSINAPLLSLRVPAGTITIL